MSAWVLVLVVMATSMSNYGPFDKDTPTQNVGILMTTITHAPGVATIDFSDKGACEAAAKTLLDADGFGTTKALCIARK
jgi:hypothetical protein